MGVVGEIPSPNPPPTAYDCEEGLRCNELYTTSSHIGVDPTLMGSTPCDRVSYTTSYIKSFVYDCDRLIID